MVDAPHTLRNVRRRAHMWASSPVLRPRYPAEYAVFVSCPLLGPFIDPDTGIARSSNDLTFITGLSVSF